MVVACLLVPVLVVAGAGAQTGSVVGPSLGDVAVRDRLIADQESLLNVYRCRFDVDTQIVPGGCIGGSPSLPAVDPDPFTGTPTAEGIWVRDQLVADQEALLNVYRCRFDIDTQIVPGGCGGQTGPIGTDPISTTGFADISAGTLHLCGISADRTAVCWGDNYYGEVDVPPGAFTAIAAGEDHSCGIRADRTAVCWGDSYRGKLDVPPGAFTAIAAGAGHSCGIRADRTAICWGSNRYGQTDVPPGAFTAIAAGDRHSCGIRADSTAVCWGSNRYGQTDVPPGAFTAIAAGDRHSCGIRADSTAICWGGNDEGQLDVPPGAFTAIAAGNEHTCGIRADSTAACWGDNWGGQLYVPPGAFTAIAAGWHHSCAVRVDGVFACWGRSDFWLEDPPEMSSQLVLIPPPIQAVYAVPSDVAPVAGREQAIADAVSAVQGWFRSQTGGRHPVFARDGSSISVVTVNLAQTASELGGNFDNVFNAIHGPNRGKGTSSFIDSVANPILLVYEGRVIFTGGPYENSCARAGFDSYVIIPLGNCPDTVLEIGARWPSRATFLIAHELVHLLGGAKRCAPNHDYSIPDVFGHVNDDPRDIMYKEYVFRTDWILDVGRDDYYLHGRDDCYDIADNPLLAKE